MNEKQYVQYKNDPNGTKWRVYDSNEKYWMVEMKDELLFLRLPKSDYILCTPPERWKDATVECEFRDTFNRGTLIHYSQESVGICELSCTAEKQGYRLRKVQLWSEHSQHLDMLTKPQWAFIVEKREY